MPWQARARRSLSAGKNVAETRLRSRRRCAAKAVWAVVGMEVRVSNRTGYLAVGPHHPGPLLPASPRPPGEEGEVSPKKKKQGSCLQILSWSLPGPLREKA